MPPIQIELEDALKARDFVKLRDALKTLPPPEIAEVIAGTPSENRAFLFRVLPRELSA
jgi:Mg/Co/Ni transporter MgtE